ncbi:hypothetical protein J32TS2_09540 [Shouchella clausii]|nr:hypothetical protein J32TS2_09540 [Shouchella clausii]
MVKTIKTLNGLTFLKKIDLLYALTVYETDLVEPLEETGLYQHLGDIQTEQTVSFKKARLFLN